MPVVQFELRVVDGVGEPLVVAEVEVGLAAVVGDVDFAVLIRAHRARIDVDVGVELLQRDLVAVAFEQGADRGGRQPLAERGHHAAGHEDVLGCSHRLSSSSARRAALPGAWRHQQPAHLFEIFRRVDADRVVGGFDGLDADAVLERPQLLERLGAFERRRLERGQHHQRAAPVGVEADVSIERRPAAARIARVGNRRARKIQREAAAIDAPPSRRSGLVSSAGVSMRRYSVVIEIDGSANGATSFGDRARIEQRLVALHVDDDVAVERGGDLGEAIGAGRVIGARQPHVAAEPGDASWRCADRRWRR